MSSKEEYLRKMQAKLDVWNAQIDRLTAKAGGYPADRSRNFNLPGKSPGTIYSRASN